MCSTGQSGFVYEETIKLNKFDLKEDTSLKIHINQFRVKSKVKIMIKAKEKKEIMNQNRKIKTSKKFFVETKVEAENFPSNLKDLISLFGDTTDKLYKIVGASENDIKDLKKENLKIKKAF